MEWIFVCRVAQEMQYSLKSLKQLIVFRISSHHIGQIPSSGSVTQIDSTLSSRRYYDCN